MSASNRITEWVSSLEKWIEARPRPLVLCPLRLTCSLGLVALLLLANLVAVARWPFSAVLRATRTVSLASGGRPLHVDRDQLERLMLSHEWVLVDFWAEWCGPCLLLNGVLKEFAEGHSGRIAVAKVDTTLHPSLTKAHRVEALPTMILFRSGEEVNRHVGPLSLGQLNELVSAAG